MSRNNPRSITVCGLPVLCFVLLFYGAHLTAQTFTAGLSFDGIDAGPLNGANNPDVNGAVGATQYVQWQDTYGGAFAVYDKVTGNLTYGPFASTKLWKGLPVVGEPSGGPCSTLASSQNIAQYDKSAGRWVMVRHVYPATPPNYVCFAVSQTSDATGNWYRYAWPVSNDIPDYPKLGVWPDAYYMSFNLLTASSPHTFVNPMVCAFDRNSMLAGSATPANPVCFQPATTLSTLLPSDLDGSTPPPTGSPNYFVNLDVNSLDIWQFHVDFTTPSNSTFTGPTNLPAGDFRQACAGRAEGACIPQLGTTELLKPWSDRLMYRLAYRNFLNSDGSENHESILAAHAVSPTQTSASAAIRWYEIRSPGSSPTIYQGRTWQPDDTSRWMMSIGMDQMGDIAVGYSESSTTQYPAIAYTGRLPTDAPGMFETPENVISPACPTGQTCNQVYNPDWGSYTSLSIDPVDDCTFWYTNQYYDQQGSKIWNTRIASFKFTSCN